MTEKTNARREIIPGVSGKVLSITETGLAEIVMNDGTVVSTQLQKSDYEDFTLTEINEFLRNKVVEYFSNTMTLGNTPGKEAGKVCKKVMRNYEDALEDIFDDEDEADKRALSISQILDTNEKFVVKMTEDKIEKDDREDFLEAKEKAQQKVYSDLLHKYKGQTLDLVGCTIDIPFSVKDGDLKSRFNNNQIKILDNGKCAGKQPLLPIKYVTFKTDDGVKRKQYVNVNLITTEEVSGLFNHLLKGFVETKSNKKEACVTKISFMPFIRVKEDTSFDGLNIYVNELEQIRSSEPSTHSDKLQTVINTVEGLRDYLEETPEAIQDMSIIIHSFEEGLEDAHITSRAGNIAIEFKHLNQRELSAEQEEAISGQMEYYGYYKLPEASSYSTGFFTGAGYGSNPKFNNFIPVSHTYGYDFLQKLIKM